jgi:hypothetical protein
MKKSNYCNFGLLIVALGFIIFLGCGTNGADASSSTSAASMMARADSGRLIIRRIPNIGSGLFLKVSIDGKRAGSVGYGQTYNGSLSAGPHVVSVLLIPNRLHLTPTERRITVEKGQTYTFTAKWQGRGLALE